MSNVISDLDIIHALKSKISEQERLIEDANSKISGYRHALSAMGVEAPTELKGIIKYIEPLVSNLDGKIDYKSALFRDSLVDVLKRESKALTARDILKHLQEGGRNISAESLSSQLATANTKARVVKKYKDDTKPITERFCYGLPEWFEGDILKVQYRS